MSVATPLLQTIEPDEPSAPSQPVSGDISLNASNTRRAEPVTLTPTNRATQGAMATNQGDAELGMVICSRRGGFVLMSSEYLKELRVSSDRYATIRTLLLLIERSPSPWQTPHYSPHTQSPCSFYFSSE